MCLWAFSFSALWSILYSVLFLGSGEKEVLSSCFDKLWQKWQMVTAHPALLNAILMTVALTRGESQSILNTIRGIVTMVRLFIFCSLHILGVQKIQFLMKVAHTSYQITLRQSAILNLK